MKHNRFTQLLSMLLILAALFSLWIIPSNAISTSGTLANSGSVTIKMDGSGGYLSKNTGGNIVGGYWQYTSNDGLTGSGYCVDWGLDGVSPSKSLAVQSYNQNPQTMGAFANGYPNRTLEQFKESHVYNVRGIDGLTEDEYKYATQVAVWATCGQISVPGTAFTAGRDTVVEPTSSAQQIRIFDSVKIILYMAQSWTKPLSAGMSIRAEENIDIRAVEIIGELGLEGAAADNVDGIKKETINGKEYYTRTMYVSSATSTWIDGYRTKVYSTDAPAGTIFVAANNTPLETVQENGTTRYVMYTNKYRDTNLNANGVEGYGAFKVCIPVDDVADSGSFTIKATGKAEQYNLFLANNPSAREQSYILSDPGYTTLEAQATFKWSSTDEPEETASLQVVKTGAGGSPLEGAEFTLTGSGGTVVTGKSDRNGQVAWSNLPADETYILTETKAPAGYTVIDPMNITLTAGRTAHLTVTDSTERTFKIKKIDAQNKASLRGAVFLFEQIDGSYMTTATTGFDGTIVFEGGALPYGSYRVTEQSAPEGYVKSDRVETVKWTGKEDVTLTWENVRDIGLTIVKVDEQTGASLPGATFDVYADGELITSVTTNSSGEARVTGLKKEAYIDVVETAAPAGYVLDKTPHGIHIDPYDPTVEADPVLTVTNRARPALRILKYDLTSNKPMPDVTFEVWHDGDLFGEYTTNASGEIFLYDLEPGTYLVKEIATDDAHVVNSTPQQIELKAGETQTRELVFFNSLKPGIHLIKVDSVTMKSLPNVRFEFKLVGGSFRQEFTTDINGEIDLSKLEPGAYEVRELEAPDGYLIDDAVRVVQVNPGENASFVFTNTPKPSLRLIKTSSDGTRLGGVHFRIARIEDGTHYLDRITDGNGEINITGLELGVYSVQETATTFDHILDTQEYHVELFAGQTSTITLVNQKRPTLTIHKIDSVTGAPIQGAKFEVWYGSNNTTTGELNSLGTYFSDADGQIVLENIRDGWYRVTELEPAAGYTIKEPATQEFYVAGDENKTVTFENIPKSALVIRKVDAGTGAPLANAWFRIRYLSGTSGSGGTIIGEYATSSNGNIIITGLDAGTYICEEISAPDGYVMDTAPQTVHISGKDQDCITLTFTNSKNGALLIKKVDSLTGKPLSGVQFFVTDSDGSVVGNSNGYFTTDSAGTILISDITPGTTLVVKETHTVSGYVLDDTPQTIKVKSNETMTLEFRNQPKGNLIVVKKDSVTGKVLPGVEFKITTASGELVADNEGLTSSSGLYVTDKNGQIILLNLNPDTYIVTETKALDGYTLAAAPQTVVINSADTQSLYFYNTPIGGLELIKASESDKTRRIPNTTFEIRRMDGGLVDTVTTDKNGRVHVALEAGDYFAVEVEAAEGFKLDNTPHYFTIKDGKTTALTVTNALFSGVIIHKVDSVTGEGIYHVKFLVYDQNKNPIGEYSTDDNGYIYIDDLTVQGKGKLFIRELEAAPGYELDKEYKTVYVQPGKTIEVEWANTPITGQIQVYKYAAEYNEVTGTPAGTPLQGAVYEISEARSGKVVDYITTDARGVAASKPLPLGRYKIVEVTAPTYWQLSGTTFDETLEYSGQIIKVSDYDKPANLGVVITKRSNAEVLAGSQMRYDFTVANTSNVALENFFWHDRVPTDAARATVLTTGTYSARLNYRILYRTNYTSEYQVLASNLLTTSNYSFALNAIPTQAGEYVTEMYFDFGKVPVGFQSTGNPTLTVQVLGTVANGYQIVNRADVGDKYQGTWQTAQASWVTIVRRLTSIPTLPKTGY